jgi:hypothetical protein
VFVVKGLEDQQRAVQELGRTVDVNFSPDVAGAPALALLGLAMALVGSMAPRTSRGRLDVRAWVSSAALLLIAAAMFMDWTWTAGDDLRPAWEIYEWADSAVIALAALTVVLAGWQPRPALLAVPILAGIMPFVEYGFLGTTPGGFQAPAGMDGSPIGIGVPIALLGLVLAASMVARTAAVDAGYRRFSSAFMVAVVFTAGVVTLAYPTYGLSSALTAIFAAGIAALAAFVLVAQLRSRDSGYEERRRTVGRSGDQ